jgi:Zn-dependent protease/CBS domain-containing protein
MARVRPLCRVYVVFALAMQLTVGRNTKQPFMIRQNIPLGRIMGIPLGLDYSWFVIFVLLTWSLAGSYYPTEFKNWPSALYWLMGVVTALLFFVSILLHELGHSVVALRYKIPVRRITLFIFGGVAQIGAEPPSAAAEFVIAIAGPVVSLCLAVVFSVVQPIVAGVAPLWGLAKYLAYINFAVFFFNLIPGYPLDGGRVFRAIVWAITGNMRRATLVAANAGRLFGFLFIFVGVWRVFGGDFGGLWIAFIGWFLDNAATAQVHQVMFQGLLAGHTVSQAMSRRCVIIPQDATLQQVVDEHILSGGQRCVLVNRGENTVGLITLHRIKEVPRDQWPRTRAAQVMLPLEKMKRISPDTQLWTALEQMDRDGVNQLPVMTDSRMVGMLSREDVITFLRTLEELSSP